MRAFGNFFWPTLAANGYPDSGLARKEESVGLEPRWNYLKRFDGSRPTTASGFVAGEFRPDLAGADGAVREAERHPADGRPAETWPAVWSRQVAGVRGSGPGGRMFGRRRGGAPSAPGRTAAERL